MISDFREGRGVGFQKSESPYIKKPSDRRKIGDGEGVKNNPPKNWISFMDGPRVGSMFYLLVTILFIVRTLMVISARFQTLAHIILLGSKTV